MMVRLIAAAILVVSIVPQVRLRADATSAQPSSDSAVYVAYYWRAKPGQIDAYNDYIRTVAVPIDEDARRAGAFEDVRTVVPASGAAAEWTHLRIFRVKSLEAARDLGAALDAATARIVPDEAKRKTNSERASTLRDFVRQEIWTELK